MKRISNTLMMFIMMFGLLANISMPIYLMISTSCLKDILPSWFIIVNFILAGLMLIFHPLIDLYLFVLAVYVLKTG